MDNSTTEDTNSDREDFKISDDGSSEGSDPLEFHFRPLPLESVPSQRPSDPDSSQPSASTPRGINIRSRQRNTALPRTPSRDAVQVGGTTLGHRRLRGHPSTGTPTGDRIRELIRRPRCGVHLLRSLRNDKHLCVPEARNDPKKLPRQPGTADNHFCPKDGDLLVHHVKKLGKRVVEFYDPEQPTCFEDGDSLLRFKVDNSSFMHQSFVTARGYLYHHGHWVYLGKDSDQMELA